MDYDDGCMFHTARGRLRAQRSIELSFPFSAGDRREIFGLNTTIILFF
ncbi:MAG: hypothetical protein K9M81_03990 [Chthoniobacterales bacterium]|nr:hypothetical protein [Chthoniobacterales bacterium]